jgi:uncharacterized protein
MFGRVAATAAIMLSAGVACGGDTGLRALLVTGQMNEYHNPALMDQAVTRYLAETGFIDLELVRTPGKGEDMSGFRPHFADFDVVLLNYDGDAWPERTRTAFEDYVRGGGGLVTVHSSDNAFPDWPAFLQMTGIGGWGGRDESFGPAVRWGAGGFELFHGPGGAFHPPPHDFLITVRDAGHPITRGLPRLWLHPHDELYSMLRGPARNLTVLATGFADPDVEQASGNHEPVLMTIRYGNGRVFHTTLGHIAATETELPESVRCIGFVTTLQRGTEWAATGRVTQRLPDSFATASHALLVESTSPPQSSPGTSQSTHRSRLSGKPPSEN